jgi:hypothetical protein
MALGATPEGAGQLKTLNPCADFKWLFLQLELK